MDVTRDPTWELRLARAVREACVEAAVAGYEDAAASGLCHEGAFEAAVSAIRRLDLAALVARARPGTGRGADAS